MLSRRNLLSAAALAPIASLAQATAAQRVVVIGGALTEIVYEFGAQSLLVGVDSTSLYPAAATKLPNVGYARTLSAEGLLSLAPSLIVATEDAGPPGVLRQLEAASVPLHVLRADHRFEGLLDRTVKLGELLDRKAEARALVERLTQQWQQVRRIRPVAKPPRVLFILSHGMNQVRIAGQETAADAVIAYAGGANALQGVSGYKPLTPEAVIAAAPDVILCTDQGLEAAGGVDGLLRLPGLAQTPAGQKRRVVSMEALEMLGFGPRLPQAVSKLARAFA